ELVRGHNFSQNLELEDEGSTNKGKAIAAGIALTRQEPHNVLRFHVERCTIRARKACERFELRSSCLETPCSDRAAAHQRERTEQAFDRHAMLVRSEQPGSILPPDEQWFPRTEQPRRRKFAGASRALHLGETLSAFRHAIGDRVQRDAYVAQRKTRPPHQIALARRSVPGEV